MSSCPTNGGIGQEAGTAVIMWACPVNLVDLLNAGDREVDEQVDQML